MKDSHLALVAAIVALVLILLFNGMDTVVTTFQADMFKPSGAFTAKGVTFLTFAMMLLPLLGAMAVFRLRDWLRS